MGAKTFANNVWSIQHVFAKCKQTHSYFYGCTTLTLVSVILTLAPWMQQRIQGAQVHCFLLVSTSLPIHWMHLLSVWWCACLHSSELSDEFNTHWKTWQDYRHVEAANLDMSKRNVSDVGHTCLHRLYSNNPECWSCCCTSLFCTYIL